MPPISPALSPVAPPPAGPVLDAVLVWFRRDLRCDDNAALYHALRAARHVYCCFILDREILDPLLARGLAADRRVEFIVASLADLNARLGALGRSHGVAGVGLIVRHAVARDDVPALARQLGVQAVYANHDEEPAAQARDARVRGTLADAGIAMHTAKDQTVFERNEVLTASGTPFSVFTPYKNAWLKKIEDDFYARAYPVEKHATQLAPLPDGFDDSIPSLQQMGFAPTNLRELKVYPGASGADITLADFLERIDAYEDTRNFPAVKGPSYLSVHLRFGTVSVRRLVREARQRTAGENPIAGGSRGAEVWLSELIWRDFYFQILHHHPHVVGSAFKPEYDKLRFEHGKHADVAFTAWCEGRTGYPLVDAAMAQLNQTGWMHNRLRMVSASFLIKDLGLDWRRGEQYFADQLIDYDLAANNGGWQWAASTGCDAQPYFRIFNPVSQSQKFDPAGKFIRRYLPQLASLPDSAIHAPWAATPLELAAGGEAWQNAAYAPPIVDHDAARRKTLARYAVVKPAGPARPG